MRDSSRIWLRTHAKELAFVLIAVAVTFVLVMYAGESEPYIRNNENFFLYTSTLVLTMVGVMATGFIFLSETIRRIQENDEEYAAPSKSVRKHMIRRLSLIFFLAAALLVWVSFLFYGIDDSFGAADSNMRMLRMGLLCATGILFAYILMFIYEMMDIYTLLGNAAEKILYNSEEKYADEKSYMRLNSKEYEDLVLSENAVFVSSLTDASSNKDNQIFCIRGSGEIPAPGSYSTAEIIATGGILDQFDSRDILRVFKDVEKILCKISEINGTTISALDTRKLESALDYDRDYTSEMGIADDIIPEYFRLKEFRDCLIIRLNSLENNPRKRKLLHDRLGHHDPSRQCNVSGQDECHASLLHGYGSDDRIGISALVGEEKERHLRVITNPVLVLKFKVLMKLDNKTLDRMDLSMFDFAYARMRGTNLSNSILKDCCFYKALLDSSNMGSCDLTNADLRDASCRNAIFDRSNMENVLTEGSNFEGFNQVEARVINTKYRNCSMSNSNAKGSIIYKCAYSRCKWSDSNLADTQLVDDSFTEMDFSNTSVDHSNIRNCVIKNSSFPNSSFNKSVMNNSFVKESLFTNSKFIGADIMSTILIENNFSNAIMTNADFTGSQLIGTKFTSAQMTKSNFTKATISAKLTRDEIRYFNVNTETLVINRDILDNIDGDSDGNLVNNYVSLQTRSKLSVFDDAVLSDSLFTDTRILNTSFRTTAMTHCLFNKTTISDSVFEKVSLSDSSVNESKFIGCTIDNTDFRESKFTSARFEKCILHDCLFDSTMSNVVFDGCNLDSSYLMGSTLHKCTFTDIENLDAKMFRDCTVITATFERCTRTDGTPFEGSFHSRDELLEALEE